MFDFNKPNINMVESSSDGTYGKFVIEPLERGYGTTLGNALRRIMLSTLPGIAVSQIKIAGVVHEFTSIDGVKEDVTDIVLNIKSLALKDNTQTTTPKVAYIKETGSKVVTAGDIKFQDDIEVINKDLVIATLNGGKNTKLDIELTITSGRGYVSADVNKSSLNSIDAIAIDSIYSPVNRVNMTVEDTRVGQITDYDKLTLEIFTNGTTTPTEAISLAAKVMCEHLNLLVDLSNKAKDAEVMIEEEESDTKEVLDMSIDELELSVRSHNCLKRANINTVSELVNKSPEDMTHVRNLGRKSLEEIKNKLEELGLGLKTSEDDI